MTKKTHKLKMERVMFFQDTTSNEGWEQRMLNAVAVASKMGLGATELVVTPRKSERPVKKKAETPVGFWTISFAPEIEGEEWKQGKEKKTIIIDEHLIQLYALRVSDVVWEAK